MRKRLFFKPLHELRLKLQRTQQLLNTEAFADWNRTSTKQAAADSDTFFESPLSDANTVSDAYKIND